MKPASLALFAAIALWAITIPARATETREPSLQTLLNAALRLANAEFHRGERWTRTVRTSALLPEIKVTVDWNMDRDESLDRYQDRPDRWGADTDRDFGFRVSAGWKFGRLVFDDDELDVQEALADMAKRREDIIDTITGWYYERKTLLLLNQVSPAETPAERVKRKTRIKELTAKIDGLTGGLLSRTLVR